jgi:hypothetical protein
VKPAAAPTIEDAAFNALLGEFVELTRRVLARNDQSEYSLMVVLADGADQTFQTLTGREGGDGGPIDLIELLRGFGAELKRAEKRFAAVLVAGAAPPKDGVESLLITGATLDGRRNSAVLELRRESDGSIRVSSVKLQPYAPHTWVMQPQRHPAGALIEGWQAAAAPSPARAWWKFWG